METLIFFVIVAIVALSALIKKIKEASAPPPTLRRPRKLYSATSEDVARFFEGVKGGQAPGVRTPAVRPGVDIVEITEADIAAPPGRTVPGRRPGFRQETPPAMDVEVIGAGDIIEGPSAGVGAAAEALGLRGPERAVEGALSIEDAQDFIGVSAVGVAPRAHLPRKPKRPASLLKKPAKKTR